jgi:hypothetical protein
MNYLDLATRHKHAKKIANHQFGGMLANSNHFWVKGQSKYLITIYV